MTTLLLLMSLSAAPAAPLHEVKLDPAGGRVVMDYLGYDAGKDRVWAPGGNTGMVFVVDAATGLVHAVRGFAARERNGHLLGPSSVTFGPVAAYVGNRADGSVCAVDRATLERGPCLTLPESPDGLAYVEATREVWATTPRSSSLTLISTANGELRLAGRIELPGAPEGYAVDGDGHFYTNLEDKDRTLAVDVRARRVLRSWAAQCGADGPRGLSLVPGRPLLVVACTDAVQTFAIDKDAPTRLDRLETGAGVDNIDVGPGPEVLAAAGKAERLVRASILPDGKLRETARVPSSKGARVVVVTAKGVGYAADSAQGRLLVLAPP
ncbi:MAG TPA: hypothetical protein VMH40_15845 [Myxococcaceae bacterium]|nr:hypothetical protein [Myxococcaceae bacterium]